MDHLAPKGLENCFDLDLESGTRSEKTEFLKLCDGLMSVDDRLLKSDALNVNEGSVESIMKCKKASSAKKPPRPPRPLSLDAYDQKLMKELAEIAMIKRARIERMKALKQKKNSKISSSSPSSSSSSSHGSYIAMLFTIIFFLIIIFQGRNSDVSIQSSPQTGSRDGNGLIAIQNQVNFSPNDSVSASYKSSTGF